MTKNYIIVIFLFLFVACSPSEQAIQNAIVLTQTAAPTSTQIPSVTPTETPTPTSTPIPLSAINLKDILLLEGDLPVRFTVEPFVSDLTGTIFEDIVGLNNFLLQRFSKTGEGKGTVAVMLFEDTNNRDIAYNYLIINNIETLYTGKSELTNIGEEGYVYYYRDSFQKSLTMNFLIFKRCNSLVYMVKTMDGEESLTLRAYAEKLDARLTDALCP